VATAVNPSVDPSSVRLRVSLPRDSASTCRACPRGSPHDRSLGKSPSIEYTVYLTTMGASGRHERPNRREEEP
jgi:hypothetical protein